MDETDVGTKFLWVANEGVLEMHGEEKHSWTHLEVGYLPSYLVRFLAQIFLTIKLTFRIILFVMELLPII